MHTIKRAAATLAAGFLLAVAVAAPAQAGGTTPKGTAQELQALQARSDAWNRYYHLGAYSPAVKRAQERRAQATNRHYGLGQYAVIRVASRFDWNDAGIGAGAMLGAILAAGGLAVAVRRRVRREQSVPTTP